MSKWTIAASLSVAALAVPAAAAGQPGNGNGNGNPHAGGYTEHPAKGHGAGGGNSGQGGGNSHNNGQGAGHAAPQAGDHPAGGPSGTSGHGKGHDPLVAYVFKGTYAGDGSVDVDHGNAFVRRHDLLGTTVEFDLSSARLTVADTNSDGSVNIDDVVTGDRVVVKAKLHKREPGAQPFSAKRLVDQTHPAPED
jgi:hypothetical protein